MEQKRKEMKKENILREIDNIKNQLIEKYRPEKIILFGSAAWGGEEINDLDLFVVKRDVPYYGTDRMRELRHLIAVNVSVDFIVYKPEEVDECLSLGDPFIKKILKKGKMLYG